MSRALQKKIHIGCRQLGLEADARRDMQLSVTGKASMTDMNEGELQLVLNHLAESGFKPASKGRFKHPLAPRKDLRLVHKLWGELGRKGALHDPSRAGLNRFIRARFGNFWQSVPADVDVLRDWKQIDQVIQALKNWGQREDIDFDWDTHAR